jgi:uncharacterized protein YndB with AHSA1/START domain
MDRSEDGVITRTGDRYQIVFVRRLNKPIEKVWAAITVPERLADWFAQVTFDGDLRVGVQFDLHFPAFDHRSRCLVLAVEPPRLFAWTWGLPDGPARLEDAVRFELVADGDGCILTLTNPGVLPRDLQSVAAGWHTTLSALEAASEGVHNPPDPARERPYLERYRDLVATL